MPFFLNKYPLFYLILFLLFSTSIAAQTIPICSTCETSKITSIPFQPNNQIFKCKSNSAGLQSIYKWGVIDSKGKVLITPNWDSIGTLSENFAEVFQYIPQRKKVNFKAGLISFENKNLLPLQYNSIQTIQTPYFRINTGKGFLLWHNTKGFISKNSYDSIVLDKQNIFLYTEQMVHRLHISTGVLTDGNIKSWGLNENGFISNPFDTLYLHRVGYKALEIVLADSITSSLKENQLLLYRNGIKIKWNLEPNYLNRKITAQKNIEFVNLKTLQDSTLIKIKTRTKADTILLIDKYFLFKRNKLWGYADTLGNIFIAPVYDTLGFMYNSRIAVKMKGKWGFLDNHENIIAQPYYQSVGDFRYGSAWIMQNKKYNFLDLSGKIINSTWYDSITATHVNYIVFAKGKVGLVNHLGQEIIGTRYLKILDFGEGACLAQTVDKQWLLLDYKENRISQRYYSNVYCLNKSKVYVLKK